MQTRGIWYHSCLPQPLPYPTLTTWAFRWTCSCVGRADTPYPRLVATHASNMRASLTFVCRLAGKEQRGGGWIWPVPTLLQHAQGPRNRTPPPIMYTKQNTHYAVGHYIYYRSVIGYYSQDVGLPVYPCNVFHLILPRMGW